MLTVMPTCHVVSQVQQSTFTTADQSTARLNQSNCQGHFRQLTFATFDSITVGENFPTYEVFQHNSAAAQSGCGRMEPE